MSFLERLSLSRRVPYQRFHCKGHLSIRDTWFCPILIQYYQIRRALSLSFFLHSFFQFSLFPAFPSLPPPSLQPSFAFSFSLSLLSCFPFLILPSLLSSPSSPHSLLSLSPLLSLPQRDGCHSRSSIRRSAVSSPEPSRNSDSS